MRIAVASVISIRGSRWAHNSGALGVYLKSLSITGKTT
jgi:hypothetical protein